MLACERLDVYRSSIELFALCARAINHFPKGNHIAQWGVPPRPPM